MSIACHTTTFMPSELVAEDRLVGTGNRQLRAGLPQPTAVYHLVSVTGHFDTEDGTGHDVYSGRLLMLVSKREASDQKDPSYDMRLIQAKQQDPAMFIRFLRDQTLKRQV